MKKLVSMLFCLCLVFVFGVSSFAATISEFNYKNGDTYLGVFKTSSMPEDNKQIMRDWLSSKRNLLIRTYNGQFWFLVVPTVNSIRITTATSGSAKIRFVGDATHGIGWSSLNSSGSFETSVKVTCYNAQEVECYIVAGSLLSLGEVSLPTPTSYIADITGNLILEDDGGLFSEPDSGGVFDTIISWLVGFWDSLLDFIKGIFVPEDGYFETWYEEIREKAEEKFSALFALYDIMKNAFESENGGSYVGDLMLEIPANHFWNGSPAMSADLLKWALPFAAGVRWMLTAIIMLFTAITCYRRLVVLFEQ